MQFRLANLEDAEAIALVHKQSRQETYCNTLLKVEISPSLSHLVLKWKKILKANLSEVWVTLSADNKICGFSSCSMIEGAKNDNIKYGKIHTLYILQKYQKQGRGKALLLNMLSTLYNKGAHKVMGEVYLQNPSLEFYKKYGANSEGSNFDKVNLEWDLSKKPLI